MILGVTVEQSTDVRTWAHCVMHVSTCVVYCLSGCFLNSVNGTAKLI